MIWHYYSFPCHLRTWPAQPAERCKSEYLRKKYGLTSIDCLTSRETADRQREEKKKCLKTKSEYQICDSVFKKCENDYNYCAKKHGIIRVDKCGVKNCGLGCGHKKSWIGHC